MCTTILQPSNTRTTHVSKMYIPKCVTENQKQQITYTPPKYWNKSFFIFKDYTKKQAFKNYRELLLTKYRKEVTCSNPTCLECTRGL